MSYKALQFSRLKSILQLERTLLSRRAGADFAMSNEDSGTRCGHKKRDNHLNEEILDGGNKAPTSSSNKLDVIITSIKNIEEGISSMNSNFEKLCSIFLGEHLKKEGEQSIPRSLDEGAVNPEPRLKEEIYGMKQSTEEVLGTETKAKDDIDNEPVKSKDLEFGLPKEQGFVTQALNEQHETKKQSFGSSPVTNCSPSTTNLHNEENSNVKRKLDLNCSDEEKSPRKGSSSLIPPFQISGFDFSVDRFTTELPTLKQCSKNVPYEGARHKRAQSLQMYLQSPKMLRR